MLSLKLAANVDARGRLTPAPPGRTTNVMFELVEVAGEWRIASAPTGIILDKDTFNTVWTAQNIYFLNGDGRLVPDTRWFLDRPTRSTQIVRELLDGPPESTPIALHTAFPAGTTLLSESVPITNGTAIVDLSTELFEADVPDMEMLKRQLAASLQPVPQVLRVELQVHGATIEETPVATPEDASSGEQQSVTVIKDGKLGYAVGDAVHPIDGLSNLVVGLNPTAVTVSPDRQTAAVRNAEGVFWVGDDSVVPIDDRTDLLEPSLDINGYVWVTDPNVPDTITATQPGEEPITLALPWLEGREAIAARVSMGGSRLAILVADQEGSAVIVAEIARDVFGSPVGIGENPSTQLWANGSPVDLDWIDETRFAALTETGLLGTSRRVTIGVFGQFSVDGGAVAGGSSISGGGRRALLRVLDDQHRLFQPQGIGWQLQQSNVDLLAKVG